MKDKKHNIPTLVWASILSAILSACQSTPSAPVSNDAEVVGTLEIVMLDMKFHPPTLDVSRSGRYRLQIKNTAAMPHDIEFTNGMRLVAKPGQTATGIIDVPDEGLAFRCSMPGHEEAGMTGVISVNGQTPASLRAHMHTPEILLKPKWVDPIAPSLPPGKVHDIELIAKEKDMAIAKEATQNLWTYNGQVPGPVIRVRQGDEIRVHFVNPASNKLPHSLDFHASQVAWNDEMEPVNPGEEKLYRWQADYAGVWMYHCGANPALHHIASGMYGMVIVEPLEGLEPVDHEFALVQSEFYVGNYGRETSFQKAASGNASPDYVVFNGVAMQYKDNPIAVRTGKKIRMFILNAGPNEDSAFHVVGTIFNRIIKEGIELSAKNKGHWGSQAVDLAPSQGAIVEFTTAEDGLYPFVTHAFNYVGKGALGLIKAGDGDPKHYRLGN